MSGTDVSYLSETKYISQNAPLRHKQPCTGGSSSTPTLSEVQPWKKTAQFDINWKIQYMLIDIKTHKQICVQTYNTLTHTYTQSVSEKYSGSTQPYPHYTHSYIVRERTTTPNRQHTSGRYEEEVHWRCCGPLRWGLWAHLHFFPCTLRTLWCKYKTLTGILPNTGSENSRAEWCEASCLAAAPGVRMRGFNFP